MIYDVNGFIAGMQSIVPKEDTLDDKYYGFSTSVMYNLDFVNGMEVELDILTTFEKLGVCKKKPQKSKIGEFPEIFYFQFIHRRTLQRLTLSTQILYVTVDVPKRTLTKTALVTYLCFKMDRRQSISTQLH